MRQEQALESRSKLLESALILFAEKGYAATSVRTINRSVGMADGLIYHYFPGGKKELLEVLINEKGTQILREIKERTRNFPTLSIIEVLEQFFCLADEISTTHLDFFKIIVKENEVKEFIHQSQFSETLMEQRKWFPAFLKVQAEKGEIREIDYEIATQVLVSLLVSNFMVKISGNGDGPMSDPNYRKRVFDYQVDLWHNPR